ncbi:MAG TPA: Na-translocating system protein MpsC family protein [Solirubrobacteraceae bacterium]
MPARASQPRSELEGRLSAEVARIFSEFYGRGPANTRTYVLERLVFSVLYEPLTIAEEALIEAGEGDLVRDARLTFEDIMGHALVDQVERLTRRTVVGYHSQIVLDPPRALEWFLLDPGQAEPTTTGSAAPVEELHAGRPGDADAATSDAAASAAPQQRGDGADGATRAALSNAINRIVRDRTGRGATATRTYVLDDCVVCLLDGALTTVERTLAEGHRADLARRLRDAVMATFEREILEEVGRILERRAVALAAQIVLSPDVLLLAIITE